MVGGLVGGNLLTVAALLPVVLRMGESLPPALKTVLMVLSLLLAASAVAALATFTFPARRSNP